ncbi:L-ascorbate peroxidase 3 [Spatholobus suberectus]|nr:L-ascorbate peroxidase 3 [Spatholobus suberectus]
MGGVDGEYLKEIETARRDLRALISGNKCAAPYMFRLAWHDAGTYNAETRTGGPNGSIRIPDELKHKANEELGKAKKLCESVKGKLKKVSYADLYQLAGVVAVEVTGGPTIDFVPGRMDSDKPPPEGLLPDGNKDARDLRNIFSRMGLSDDKDIVALCGGLRTMYLGEKPKCETNIDDSEGQWTEDPLKFDNSYFKRLLSSNENESLRLDRALATDNKFLRYVELYAKDVDVFFKDYAIAHKKLSELGCNLKKPNKVVIGIGIASAVVTVILGYLLKRKKDQLKK